MLKQFDRDLSNIYGNLLHERSPCRNLCLGIPYLSTKSILFPFIILIQWVKGFVQEKSFYSFFKCSSVEIAVLKLTGYEHCLQLSNYRRI